LDTSSLKKGSKLFSIYFGNLFEHYDTALYTFLSPLFATLFFPEKDHLTALILTFGITPLGMLARPIGSLVFGTIGDVVGRGRALFLSLLGMAAVTGFIGMIPTTSQIGWSAPILLLLSRVMQNFFAAGENMGGAICTIERVESKQKKDFASSVYSTSSVLGILVASGMVAVLYHYEWIETGWRWLYLGAAATAFCAVAVRSFPEFNADHSDAKKSHELTLIDRLLSLWEMRQIVCAIAVVSGFSYATYSIAFSFMNAFVPLVCGISKATITKMNTFFLLFDVFLLPVAGIAASRWSRTNMMLGASLSTIAAGIPLFLFLNQGSLVAVVLVRLAFVVIGVFFSATFHSWSVDLVPREYRYSVISFAYSIGSQLLGGTTAMISLWLYKQTSLVASAALYWVVLAALTSVMLVKSGAVESTEMTEMN